MNKNEIKKIFTELKEEHKQLLKNAYDLMAGASEDDIDIAFDALHELQVDSDGDW